MIDKLAGTYGFTMNSLTGKTLRKAIKKKKSIKKKGLNGLSDAKKSVRRARDAQSLTRGTAAVGLGTGAYLASQDKEQPLIPRDY